MKNNFYKLTLITQKNNQSIESYLNFIKMCIKGGVTAVQLREKKLKWNDLVSFGHILQKFLVTLQIPLIINDHLELAIKLNAHGVHLGQADGDVHKARNHLGPHKIIGLTINSRKELLNANILPIDYVGVGAIFPTQNKPNVQTIWGCDKLFKIVPLSKHKIIAVGGINLTNAQKVAQTGAHGIAAIGAFHNAKNPTQIAQRLRKLLKKNSSC